MTLKPRWPRSMTTAGVFRKLRKRIVNVSPWNRRMLGLIEGTGPSWPTWGKQSKQQSSSSERSPLIPQDEKSKFYPDKLSEEHPHLQLRSPRRRTRLTVI